jgi:ABC-type nitrate/sulfonate/bicarbonate transport system substrate-binding protein
MWNETAQSLTSLTTGITTGQVTPWGLLIGSGGVIAFLFHHIQSLNEKLLSRSDLAAKERQETLEKLVMALQGVAQSQKETTTLLSMLQREAEDIKNSLQRLGPRSTK